MKLPWGILILFGGGLSLAAAVQANGVAEFSGAQAAGLKGVPPFVLVLAVATGVIFLTELTSNTATTATLVSCFSQACSGCRCFPRNAYLFPRPSPQAVLHDAGRDPRRTRSFSVRPYNRSSDGKSRFLAKLIGIALVTLVLYFVRNTVDRNFNVVRIGNRFQLTGNTRCLWTRLNRKDPNPLIWRVPQAN